MIFIVNLIFLAALTGQNEPVIKANFQLAEKWAVDKQLERISGIWTEPHWLPDSDTFIYKTKDEYYLVDPALRTKEKFKDKERIKELTRPPKATDPRVQVSPDGGKRAVLRDYNLFIDDIQVTQDGNEDHRFSPQSGWSPDSRYFVFLREDWRPVKDLWLVNSLDNPRPTLQTYKWPMPGEAVEQYSLWIYDTVKKQTLPVEAEMWTDQTLEQVDWLPDSSGFCFTRMSRDWMSLDLCCADPATGKCKTLVEERGYRQIITRLPYRILQSTGEILWWSMRKGWGHYYLYDRSGQLTTPVTVDAFHAGRIIRLDEEERVLYFMGNGEVAGKNPYLHHLYRVNLDGWELKRLTPEEAEHEVYFSPTGQYFLDNYSRSDLPPQAVVRNNEGEPILRLESADISSLEEAGWSHPEIFKAKAADGKTDLWGVLFKPFDFDPEKKYPIISYGYPGKEGEALPWKFYYNSWVTLTSVSLAQYGFIVAVYGNRGGSPERSYDYYDFGWDDLRDYPIADKKIVIEQLAEERKYIDPDRVGIMGASSGGFMAATAILTEPDFFKVAVSRAGNHDNNLYWHHWNERYGAVKETPDKGFLSRSPTNNEVALNLKGRLLLIQGDMDLAVPPSQTLRLADALIEAGKRFDMLIVPGCDHSFGKNWKYLIRSMELYFVENLLGDPRWSADIFESLRPE